MKSPFTYQEIVNNSPRILAKLRDPLKVKSMDDIAELCKETYTDYGIYYSYVDIHGYEHLAKDLLRFAESTVADYEIIYVDVTSSDNVPLLMPRIRGVLVEARYYTSLPPNFLDLPEYLFLNPKL